MRQRGTLASSLVLLSILAAGSYWLAVRARLLDPVAKSPAHEVDYYADQFQMVRMDDQGHATYQLNSSHMAHYADDDSTVFTNPSITSLSPDRPVMRLTAEHGDASSGGDIVHMTGDVELRREPSGDDPGLLATASRMTVYPDDDVAETDVPVHVVHGKSTMDGDNMWFSNTDRVLKLNNDLPGHRTNLSIEPRVKPAPAPAPVSKG